MSKIFKFSLSVIFFLISITLIIFFFNLKLKSDCYEKCAEFHLLGEATFWEFSDYVVFNEDTVWVDKECYDDWCICIDECKPGLCCKLLNKKN